MVKMVVYESKYGDAKRVAELIIEGVSEIGGIEVFLKELKKSRS
ncbi:MAG: hypothetical protein QXG56_04145 [Candidatus Bathyarchaeia archaeon]